MVLDLLTITQDGTRREFSGHNIAEIDKKK